ncbi:MAG TPA: hypothetical protein VGE38_06480 [Nocardioides sp.]|uniref:hypothetical protein n=1 Tax=Nocardioides sp. TaxID=35761 RepID=UPI002ED78755
MSTTPPDGPDSPETPETPSSPPTPPGYGTPYGGYGTPPPPPPPAGFGGPQSQPWSLGDALSYGWTKFTANLGQILVAAIVFLLGVAIALGIAVALVSALTTSSTLNLETGEIEGGSNFLTRTLAQTLAGFVVSCVVWILGAVIVRGALDVADGRPLEFGSLFSRLNLGNVVVASVLVAVLVAVGTALCYIPGIIVGFLASYTLYFLIDQDLSAVDAIKASFTFTKEHLGETIVWYIVGGIVAMVGFCLCGVGALVSVPVVVLGTAYTYKKLTGQPVAA